MAASDSLRAALTTLLTAALALSLAGCRGTPQPVTRTEPPKAPKNEPAPAAAAAPQQAQAPEASPQRTKSEDATPVVVDAGVDDRATPRTLVEASHAERARRAGAGKPMAVINDKTLSKYASKGQITIAEPKKDKDKEKNRAASAALAAAAAAEAQDEQHWRSRARQLRENWHSLSDEVKDLEQKSAALRQKFYGETDTFLRDTQVKPDWDRVLDRLRQARLDVDAAKQDLAKFLEEGRSAGAQPGWLDEGLEEEPADEAGKTEPSPSLQSIEPPVLNSQDIQSPPPGA